MLAREISERLRFVRCLHSAERGGGEKGRFLFCVHPKKILQRLLSFAIGPSMTESGPAGLELLPEDLLSLLVHRFSHTVLLKYALCAPRRGLVEI